MSTDTELIATSAEWIGVVPTWWAIEPLGRWFHERKSTVSDADYVPLSVTMQGIVPQLANVAKTENNANRKLVRKGDFAINSRSDRKGSAGVSELDGSVSVITTVLKPRGLDPRFTHHLLRSRPFQEEFYRWGHGIVDDLWSTKWSDMKSIKIPVPSESEQRAIADYLDRETSQIDAFIAKNEELIALLTERRASSIVELIGRHETIPLKRLVSSKRPLTYGILQCGEPVENGIPYIGPSDLPGEGVSPVLPSLRRTTPEIAAAYRRSVLAGGDIVVSIGPAFGRVGLLSDDLAGANLTQDTVRVATMPGKVDAHYLVWVLSSRIADDFWDCKILGATFRRLNLGTLGETPIPLPSIDEQQRIAGMIDDAVAKIDTAIGVAKQAVELARERRAALISAAVTGKINVREAA
ncbi:MULTISPECIES: restriction endonuclease subunit S [unclassified Microbacterium]|uniref:restriction endonuclease subunit S n=1 Tax=unclassified Microbacterium TaxID=2609290 RepID=UPI00343818C1